MSVDAKTNQPTANIYQASTEKEPYNFFNQQPTDQMNAIYTIQGTNGIGGVSETFSPGNYPAGNFGYNASFLMRPAPTAALDHRTSAGWPGSVSGQATTAPNANTGLSANFLTGGYSAVDTNAYGAMYNNFGGGGSGFSTVGPSLGWGDLAANGPTAEFWATSDVRKNITTTTYQPQQQQQQQQVGGDYYGGGSNSGQQANLTTAGGVGGGVDPQVPHHQQQQQHQPSQNLLGGVQADQYYSNPAAAGTGVATSVSGMDRQHDVHFINDSVQALTLNAGSNAPSDHMLMTSVGGGQSAANVAVSGGLHEHLTAGGAAGSSGGGGSSEKPLNVGSGQPKTWASIAGQPAAKPTRQVVHRAPVITSTNKRADSGAVNSWDKGGSGGGLKSTTSSGQQRPTSFGQKSGASNMNSQRPTSTGVRQQQQPFPSGGGSDVKSANKMMGGGVGGNSNSLSHNEHGGVVDGGGPPHPTLEKLITENQYNPKVYDIDCKDARFFVIKSYSEDDIHRSIKYSIWCSTEYGNRRLDNAFTEKNGKAGPVYLFFSVNGSGHFCGMAQMMSRVDYDSSSGVWSLDNKWNGRFTVKWIYVKDVPNSALRHIRLENNENKPVTNSRDAQAVPIDKGRQVLKIMHNFKHQTSIFDDFGHYERKQEEDSEKRTLNQHR